VIGGTGSRGDRTVLLVVGHATGGIGEHVAALARDLPGHGWWPRVLTSPLTASRFDLGPDVVPLWPVLTSPAAVAAARRAAAGAAVVHAHGHQAGTVAAVLDLLVRPTAPVAGRRIPLAISWHNAVLAGGARGALLGLAERWQARRADLVTGASEDLVARARALGARRAELAPVASALPARSAPGDPGSVRAALGLAAGVPVLLTVSRIAPQKDLDVLVDAAARLGPGAVWLVAGDGDPDLLARLRQRARDAGADVRFLGRRDDIPDLLALADVFVLASRWEARSLAVQEAMAAGLPVVVTGTGGLPELVGEAGLTVPVGSPAALAAAIGGLLADPDLARALGAAAQVRFAGFPTSEQVLTGWAARYARLAGPSPA
jgi:glycosyltransferase involved in cell wall biosynthesis